MHKVTQYLSEISTFFKKSGSDHAMFSIMDVIKGMRMNELTLFGRKTRCNSKYSLLQVFQLLLVCPCFMIRNPFNIYGSPLGGKIGCRKDVFYGLLNDGRTDWHKLMYHIVCQLWTKVISRSKRGPWNGLPTTDLALGFFEAYRIYSRRWSQEVIFKESKGLLGMGKCLSANFAAQIASTSLVAL